MKTIKVGGRELPFESNPIVEQVDTFTEAAIVDGIVHLGFGRIITLIESQDAYVKDVVRLRFSPIMLARLADQIAKLSKSLSKQQTPN